MRCVNQLQEKVMCVSVCWQLWVMAVWLTSPGSESGSGGWLRTLPSYPDVSSAAPRSRASRCFCEPWDSRGKESASASNKQTSNPKQMDAIIPLFMPTVKTTTCNIMYSIHTHIYTQTCMFDIVQYSSAILSRADLVFLQLRILFFLWQLVQTLRKLIN